MTQRPTLSLAMIVRDEERRLARALASVRGLVGEVVVVDTGSRDATAALAAECGARVIERPWTEDFAEARNASLEAFRGEWILQLDADEALDAEARKAIAEAVHREDVEGWFLRQRNYVPGGCQSIRAMRLWRNEPEARFVYPIHEQILPGVLRAAARTGRRIETLEAGVEHYGYLQEPEVVAAKLTRNARLMERWLAEHPEDLYLRYVLAGTLAQLGRPEDALGAYARAFRLLRTLPEDEARRRECGPNLCALYGQALLRDRADRDGARQIVSFGRRLFPEAPELLFLDGVLAREEGDLGRAIRCFSACAERGPRAEALHADEGV
ncbi:MAG: glycosyltransferase family 2 protein, partial [Candidatus Methylomirabilis sp.]|nr:glycosyltransferase family 2 protein [Deltaproteobacteria bacterium]